MVRRHNYAQHESRIEAAAGAAYSIAPGEVTSADVRAYIERSAPGRGGESPAPGAVLDSYEWASDWGRFLSAMQHDRAAQEIAATAARTLGPRNAAMSERVPSEGGFLVPENLRMSVTAYMTAAAVWPRATVFPMDSLTLPLPVLDNFDQQNSAQVLGGLTFSLVGEALAIPSTTPAFSRVVLEARKVAGLLQGVPNELPDDAAGAWDAFIGPVVGRGLAWALDDMFIVNGSGTGEPQSVANAPCAIDVSRATAGKVQAADLIGVYKKLHPASKTSATWLVSADAFDQLLEVYLNVGGATPGTDITPAAMPDWLCYDPQARCWRILGLECIVGDHQPALGTAGDVVLADLRFYAIGDRRALTVERAQQGAGFIADTSDFRIRTRVDARYLIRGSITTQTGLVVSPVVVLT